MPKPLWAMIAVSVYASMTGACANRPLSYAVAPPLLALPPEVERPCALAMVEDSGDLAALEVAYMQRGQQILACDGARALAVEIMKLERALRENTRG